MKILPKIIHSTLLITTPSLIAQPLDGTPRSFVQPKTQLIQIPNLRTLSYNEVIDLLALIESDSFSERCSIEELDQINQFVSFLAMEGAADEAKFDIQNASASLFQKDSIQNALFLDSSYAIHPAIYVEGTQNVLLCRSWFKKQWDKTRAFVSRHKTAIIVGTIVAVTVAATVVAIVAFSSAAAGAAAATAGGGALASTADPAPATEPPQVPQVTESLVSSLQEQVSSFKETIVPEQFSVATGISPEENGKIVGSLFAHKTIDAIVPTHPPFECNPFGLPKWDYSADIHMSIDSAFSTDFTTSYSGNYNDLNALSYEMRGHRALHSGYYTQAVHDFEKSISLDSSNPTLYLEKGIANFELGNYAHSIADYSHYLEKQSDFSVTDFTLGFAKGVPKGAYESGQGALLFLSEFIAHPVHTSKQVVDSLGQLASLVKNDEFGVIAETLSPELYQLTTQWDTLPSATKGELAGYAFGKLGMDLLAPGAIAKVASRSLNSAKELATICKNMQLAQETLLLETASGIGIPAKISEIVEMGKKAATLGEELGYTSQEIGQLQQAGKLHATVTNAYEYLSPGMRESFELFKKAQAFLEQHKGFMSESQARELIHQTGIRTFPRPPGIPENFRVRLSDKGAGIKYVHPIDEGTYIRIMPGKPHSPHAHQQKPYVSYLKNGSYLDKNGNIVRYNDPAAHIPYEEFVYRD